MKTLRLRYAVSLVELLITMSACTGILTLSAGLLHRTMQVGGKSRAFIDGERSALRLANAFRHDVHQAADAANGDANEGKGTILHLNLGGDHVVEYRHTADKVTRVLFENGQVRAREEFAFPSTVDVTIQQESPQLVVLSITTPLEAVSADQPTSPSIAYITPVSCHVEAVVGRDHWFTAPATDGEEAQ